MIGAAYISRIHSGSSKNSLLPAYAVISILFGLSTHQIFRLLEPSLSKKVILQVFIYIVYIVQFAILMYNPVSQIPTQRDLKAAKEFIITIKQIQGNIWVPYHGYLPFLAGEKSYAHAAAI